MNHDLNRSRLGSRLSALLYCTCVLSVICGHMAIFSLNSCHAAADDAEVEQAQRRTYAPLDLTLFRDSIHHWQMKDGRGRQDPRFQPEQIVQIAENLLRFQNPDGGWPTNLDWLAQIDVAEIRRIRQGSVGRSSFDNRNTYPQIDYLARVYLKTGLQRYRDAAVRGLEYVVAQQRPSGGWRGSDVDAITFNDDVMVGIMNELLDIREGTSEYEWLDDAMRDRLSQALTSAIEATLKCQIVVDGRKTAWCQQHDHITYQPIRARTYELPSITAQESTGVVEFLIRLPQPTADVIEAVDRAATWFESAKLEGIRIEKIPISPVRFEGFTAEFDRVVIADPRARPVWARFYDINSSRPFFCNRDGIKVEQLSDVLLERRVGYAWYGYWPTQLLAETYPAWKTRIADSR